MFESCLGVSVDDMSLINITKDEYIDQIKAISNAEYSDEIKECIEKMKYYTSALKGKKIKGFNYKSFKNSGNKFIEQLKIAHESPSTNLEHNDYRYFKYQQGSEEATLSEIQFDIVE